MTTIKSYTDMEQSKKLAEILPLESADMAWCNNSIKGINYTDMYSANLYTVKEMKDAFDEALVGWDKHWKLIPCWSLTALLDVLPFPALRYDIEDGEGGWIVSCEKNDKMYLSYYKDNPVDTCYELILKLHEQKLL